MSLPLRALFCLLLLALPLHLPAQQRLATARQRSYLTKVFRLTDAQTRQLYETDLSRARPEFFTQPVDSFPTDSAALGRRRPLPPGYYLVAHTEGAQLVYWLRAVTDRQLTLLDNQTDLTLLVRDSLGRLLEDARVSLSKGQVVPFDAATRSYRLPGKAGRAGLLAVEHGGRTTFHALEQTFPSGERRRPVWGWRRVVYGFPLGYLTRPVRSLYFQLRHPSYTTTGLVGLLRSVFSEDVRDQRQSRRQDRNQDEWVSYLALSKPLYRPTHDTLRLKARILRQRDGQPYNRPLELRLYGQGRPKSLAVLKPVRPGSYEYTLPLSDTLNLRADQTVRVRLLEPGDTGKQLASGSFRLEDYELKNTRYTLRAAETPHRRGTPQALFLRGQDANDLNLLDARVRLSVTPAGVGAFLGRQVFVPDTLWTRAQPLDATGETRLNLPETILPAANLTYSVQATFLNSDNERRTQAQAVSYTLDPGELLLELRHDSLLARYAVRGSSQPATATLETEALNYLQVPTMRRETVTLPLARPLDARATRYRLFDAAGHEAQLTLHEENAGLLLRSDRTTDSIRLAVENPRQLPFWYYLYRGNTLVQRGYGPDFALQTAAAGPEPWYVSVHYFWGGQLLTAEYNVPLPQHRLLIQADQPEVVYPGQRVRLQYTVTDGGGRPVPRADLTAYAHTSKFAVDEAPEIPDFEPAVAGRLSLRRFRLGAGFENQAERPGQQPLIWGAWRQRLGLDSLRFYQFLYPEYGTFHEYQIAPGGITQISPFVVDSGRVQPAVAVYVDGVPVYVAGVNGEEPFALVADSGQHAVAVRTPNRLVTLRGVRLRHLHKLTLSIDPNQPCHELTVEKRGPLTEAERQQLQRFLLLIDKRDYDEQVLLRQGNRLQPLGAGRPVPVAGASTRRFSYSSYNRYDRADFHLAGPFRPDSVLLRRSDGLRRKFLLEPNYRFTFGAGLLKMRCVQGSEFGRLGEATSFGVLPFQDFAYTEADLKPQPATGYYRSSYSPEPELDNPVTTPAGQGRLTVRLPVPPAANATRRQPATLPPVLYTLLTQSGNPKFVRLEYGLPQTVHALPTGRYRLALLLADSTVLAPAPEVSVQPNGATYVQLDSADLLPAGPAVRALRRRFRQLVQERLPRPNATTQPREERREVQVKVPVVPQPGWRVQRGRIEDKQSGEGLPGVTVLLKGTTIGTTTNADGSFELSVPPDGGLLLISSIGYVNLEHRLDGRDMLVGMVADSKHLDEVVVVGYGVEQRRRNLSASVSTITSASLSGRVAGVQIRGISTLGGSGAPLLIVDGLPFSGNQADINPDDIAGMKVMKGAAAAATFGSRAANGVIVITTKSGVGGRRALGFDADPAPAIGPDGQPTAGRDPRLSLRRRFSDSGWWRPSLVTDAQGRVSTEVIVPDDITGWDTFVLASDDHARTGSFTALMRSFKAVLGELAAPRFLIEGDRAQLLGKTLNYLPDTAQVTTSFRVGEGPARSQRHQVSTAALDTLTLTAPSGGPDSVAVSFQLTQPNGYQDGELRYLPVLPAGTRERVGTFAVLTALDTTLTLPIRPELGPVTVRLESDPLPTLLDEIRHVQRYAYLCNEQAASKLKTLLLEQRIREQLKQPFEGDKDVNRLIRHLLRGRHQPEGLWGTWPGAAVSPWATLHVVEALLEATQQGYAVKLDRDALRSYLLRQLDVAFADAAARAALAATLTGQRYEALYFQSDDDRIRLLQLLHRLGAQPDFRTYVLRLEREAPAGKKVHHPLDRYLALANLRQQLGLPFQLDTLRRYRLRTELGGVFYADTLRDGAFYRYLLPDRTANTLLAYRLLRARGGQEAELTRIRTYLLQQRRSASHWGSTYEAALILETIAPDLLVAGSQGLMARAQLSGALSQQVSKFPFDTIAAAGAGPLVLRKEGGLPVYATAYQSFWNAAPVAVAAPFGVRTTLAGQEGSRVLLKAGQPAELLVTVDVKAEARYVLLEVPIPAGCSYGEKAPGNSFEVHREYLRHQVGIFIDVLPIGRHTFRVALQPRYRGRYTLNPAKTELMYFPTRFGRSASKQAVVE